MPTFGRNRPQMAVRLSACCKNVSHNSELDIGRVAFLTSPLNVGVLVTGRKL